MLLLYKHIITSCNNVHPRLQPEKGKRMEISITLKITKDKNNPQTKIHGNYSEVRFEPLTKEEREKMDSDHAISSRSSDNTS